MQVMIKQQEFMKRWARGLEIYRKRKKNMSLVERKNAIKLSADVAMASTKLSTTQWSRALISDASSSTTDNNILVQHVLINSTIASDHDMIINNYNILDQLNSSKQSLSSTSMCINNANKRIIQSKKILRKSRARVVRKSCGHNYYPPKVLAATSIAKRIVKKRTKMLKSLVPGGKSMDDVAIIKEALDYVLSLQFQVNIMRRLAEISNPNQLA